MRSCFTSFHKRVYNLVSLTTIEVESAHSVVHLLQRSTLIGVNVRKKLWKWSQRSLKEDNPVGGVLFYLPWSCRPHRYSNDITCTNSTIEYAEHEGLGANILVLRCVRWQKLELTRRTSIREKFSQVNGRKSLPWLIYVIREKLWKLLKWTISFGWKKINLRLTVSKDFNVSMLVEKIITHRKGLFKLRKWTKNKNLWSGSGLAGINRRDYGT